MSNFCGSEFWNTTLTWNSSSPHFTPCFQKTFLLGLPSLYLWVFAPLQAYRIYKSKNKDIPWSWVNISKIVLSVIMIMVELGLFSAIVVSNNAEHIYPVDYFYPWMLIISICLQMAVVLMEKKKGIQASGFLFGFWILLLVFAIPGYIASFDLIVNQVMTDSESAEAWCYIVFYPCVFLMFLLNCFADKKPQFEFYPRGKNYCPILGASFLNYITFHWLDSLIWNGSKKPVEQKDLWDLPPDNTSEVIVKEWDKHWNKKYNELPSADKKTLGKKQPYSVLPVLIKTFRYEFLLGMFLKLIPDLLTFVSPQIIRLLIEYASDVDIEEWKGYVYVVFLFVVLELQSFLNAQQFVVMYTIGLRIRTAITSLVYRKALKISSASKKKSTVGEVVNLMAVDIQRFLDLMGYINALWSAPLQIALCIYFLCQLLGPSALVGLLVMIFLIPINGWIVSKQKRYQVTQMKHKDKRVKIINEILNGIKVLKLYAWEPSFIQQISNVRKVEIRELEKSSYLGSATTFVFTSTPFLVSFFIFMTYVLVSPDNILSPDIVFVAISLLNILRMPMLILPLIMVSLVQASVSMKRLNKFMNADELDPEAVEHNMSEDDPIIIDNATFSWGHEEEDQPILKDINFRVKKGSLVGVVGTVGTGKSSLCSAILGEMEKNSGRVNVNKSIAFVPQQAWIQNANLKDNILFSADLDSSYYKQVIQACALKPDLEMLAEGDRTEIGEKGINLSGGQKQRVSLARAVYSNSEIYLLDDPLSAVDSHVGKHIFEHVIGPQGILKNKTRVLVTHGLGYLRKLDEIFVLKDGRIVEQGSFSHLLNKKGDFQEFLLQYLTESEREEDEDLEPEVLEEIKSKLQQTLGENRFQRQFSKQSRTSEGKCKRRESEAGSITTSQKNASIKSLKNMKIIEDVNKGKLIKEEKAEVGTTSLAVYGYYAKSIGIITAVATIILYALSQAFSVLGNILLSEWSDNPNGAEPKVRNHYLYVYAAFGISSAISIMFGYATLVRGSIVCSQILHDKMLSNVLRSPMSFFDMTPIGRIVNRFSKDIDILDIMLQMNIRSFLYCLLGVLSTFGAIIYATPMFAVVIVPAMIVYFFVQTIYVKTSRQLKRIESITRSPIYTHFSESIQGSTTIRAYVKQAEFISQSEQKVDFNQLSYFPNIISYRWLSIRLEFIGSLLTFFAALFTVLNRENLSGGDVGLSISYALSVTQLLTFLVRITSDVETNIVSVERIKEYTEIEQEAPTKIEHKQPPEEWPQQGMVHFKGYSTRYRKGLDLVIKDIECEIQPTEKIGIVGRTGAGKSSMTLALFRIVEPAHGTIIIDGVDISKIGLHDLREKLTIIPQDPVLFSGTLRMNLDPFEKHSDDSLWYVLEHSHLKEFVSGLPTKLNHDIAEGGENLSVGQRQLVCLARALLRKTKILILDEATAAVDLETDNLIQDTIRREFADCTVITIAHRLNTIMDSTRIIVLDKGEIKEFDTPDNLLQNHTSLFYDMVKDAGLV